MDLLEAAREGDVSVLRAFFAEPDATQKYLEVRAEGSLATPLHMAAANGHEEVVSLIVNSIAKERAQQAVNAQNDAGNTALHWAALTGSLPVAQVLVEAGANAMIKNKAGFDAIFQAEAAENEEVVDFLLSKFDVTKGPESFDEAEEKEMQAEA